MDATESVVKCVFLCVTCSEAIERSSVESHNSLRQRQQFEITGTLDV